MTYYSFRSDEHKRHAPQCPYVLLAKTDENDFTALEFANLVEQMLLNLAVSFLSYLSGVNKTKWETREKFKLIVTFRFQLTYFSTGWVITGSTKEITWDAWTYRKRLKTNRKKEENVRKKLFWRNVFFFIIFDVQHLYEELSISIRIVPRIKFVPITLIRDSIVIWCVVII